MSLNPHWFSTVWGVIFMVGQVLSALCLMVMLLARLSEEEPLRAVARKGTVHDLGKLMLAFTMLWAYLHLSQFLIIWSGNIAEETPFYLSRLHGGFKALAWLLLLLHFVVPFLLLLSRDLKRNARTLALVAAAMFVLRFVDLYWLVGPDLAGHHGDGHGPAFHPSYLTAAVGLGGAWLWSFFGAVRQAPILPVGDPEVQEMLARPAAEGAH
jgi:Ni/Fe-hydrogenase subunit HybB-like protein